MSEQRHNSRFAMAASPLKKLLADSSLRAAGRLGVGLAWLLGDRSASRLGILRYRRISPRIPGLSAPTNNVTPRRFREQLRGLLRRGFVPWSLDDVLDWTRRGETVPAKTLIVTFDAGFASVFTNAWPILKELHVPATIFLSTAYIDTAQPFPFDAWGAKCRDLAAIDSYRPLSTTQIHEMLESHLIQIGVHTHSHQDYRHRPDEFQADLRKSVDIVQGRFGGDEIAFAFPWESRQSEFASSDDLADAARATGVTCGLTAEPMLVNQTDDRFRWGRFNCYPWDSSRTLAAKLENWYSWAPNLQTVLSAKIRRWRWRENPDRIDDRHDDSSAREGATR